MATQSETQKETNTEPPKEKLQEVAKYIAKHTSRSVMELNRQVKTFDAVHDEESRAFVTQTVIADTMKAFPEIQLDQKAVAAVVQEAFKTCVQELTNRVIPIPKTVVQPYNLQK